jgi:hypothetical protein
LTIIKNNNSMNTLPHPSLSNQFLHPALARVLMVTIGLLLGQIARADTITNIYTASGSWVCPEDVTLVQVEVWGGGGGGGSAFRNASGSVYGSGGGGGAYARLNVFPVTPGSNYVFVVGAAGTASGGDGNPTYFIEPSVLHANGGAAGTNAISGASDVSRPGGGPGGAVGVTGDVQYAGGNGGTPTSGTVYAAQGGGSAGSGSAGNNGSFNVAGETAAVTDGGPGGASNPTASTSGPGQAPSGGPGGGGGGARASVNVTHPGGAGAPGQVRLIYDATVTGTNTTTTVATSGSPSAPGQTVTFTATIAPSIGTDVPTGSVQFKTNGVALGAPVTVTTGTSPNGTASISTSELPVAGSPHTVTAEYTATGPFNSSVGTLVGGQAVVAVSQFDWNNAGGGDWNTPANWTPAGPPINAVARVDNGGTANLTSDAPYPITNLRVGYGTGGTTGTLNIGANLMATAASEIGRSGSGTINITNGQLEFMGATTVTFRLGVLAAGTGTGTQSGGTLVSAGSLFVGVQGNASYTLSSGSIHASNNFTVASSAGSVATLTQSGGTISVGSAVANSGQSFVGQGGTGTFNLSGGTLKSTAFSIGQNIGASGTVNQTGGTIDLLSGPAGAGSMTIGSLGTGVYSISNGTLQAVNLTVMVSSNLTGIGTLNIAGSSTVNCTGQLVLGSNGVINVAFRTNGVAQMNFAGTDTNFFDIGSQINVDGSAYVGGPGSFTLIDAVSFEGTPTITLNNFALGATHVWDTNSGNFTVTVGTVVEPPDIAYSLSGGTLELAWPGYLGWYAQSNSVSLADTNYWFDIVGSESATNLSITINPALTNVFYRLRQP